MYAGCSYIVALLVVGLFAHPRTLSAPETTGRTSAWILKCPKHWGSRLTANTSVVGLDVDVGDLSILDHEGVSLASVVSQDGCGVELNIEGTGEAAVRVTEEANATALVCVERFAPGIHTVER
jgi:hypothetical protein